MSPSPLPYPFDSVFVRTIVGRFGLPLWFIALQGPTFHMIASGYIALDARIYGGAARAWLAGRDPWSVAVEVAGHQYHFAAAPLNLVPLAPLGILPEPLGVAVIMALNLTATFAILRHLHLPWWWLFFPPLTQALVSGNPSLIVLGLLLAPPYVAPLAGLVKIYAWIPLVLIGGARMLVASAIAGIVGVLLSLPLWVDYLRRFTEISARLVVEAEGGYSAWTWPVPLLALVLGAVLLLLVVDRPVAAWLAVPALWPASQVHYATLGLPVMRGLLPWILAIPLPGVVPATLVAIAALAVTRRVATRVVVAARAAGPQAGREGLSVGRAHAEGDRQGCLRVRTEHEGQERHEAAVHGQGSQALH